MSQLWTRINKNFLFSSILLFSTLCAVLAADDTFDCHITKDGHTFDLTPLSGQHTASRTRDTPPTTITDSVIFDLCKDLPLNEDVSSSDQCPTGSRACLTKTNRKDNNDRIVAVIPVARSPNLNPESRIISSPSNGLELIFHGEEYPVPNEETKSSQSFNLTLLCADSQTEPTFTSYDGFVLSLQWKAPAACADKKSDGSNPPADSPPQQDGESSSRGSGVGWFFLVLLLAFLAYFALGAYYNYSNYGASGYDLIPHRDFWREVPFMLRDVVSHLCSTIRPRQSSRGGYIAV